MKVWTIFVSISRSVYFSVELISEKSKRKEVAFFKLIFCRSAFECNTNVYKNECALVILYNLGIIRYNSRLRIFKVNLKQP